MPNGQSEVTITADDRKALEIICASGDDTSSLTVIVLSRALAPALHAYARASGAFVYLSGYAFQFDGGAIEDRLSILWKAEPTTRSDELNLKVSGKLKNGQPFVRGKMTFGFFSTERPAER